MRLPDSDGRFELLMDMLRLRSSFNQRRRHSTATLRREEEYQLGEEVADVRTLGCAADLSAFLRGA